MKNLTKKIMVLALAFTLLFSITACSSTSSTSSTQTTAAESTYPVTVTDALGRNVTIEKEPEKLVSGYYITSSLMIAIGLDNKLVGVEAKANTREIYSLAAPEIINLPNVGTAKEFNLEGCAALNPDLVILPVKLKDSIPSLEELGIKVIAVNPEDQQLLFDTIDIIGKATNTVAQCSSLKNSITTSLEELKSKLSSSNKPTVYLAGNSSILTTASSSMYQNTLIDNAGGLNVASEISDTYWSNVSYEQILQWNPEYIFLASDATYTVDSILSDSALSECKAVKDKHVYQLPGNIEAVDSPVPASFLGSFYMASILHSDLISTADYNNKVTDFYNTFYSFKPQN